MKNQLLFSSVVDGHYYDYSNSSRSIAPNDDSDNNSYCWWRWVAEFDHVKKMQMKLIMSASYSPAAEGHLVILQQQQGCEWCESWRDWLWYQPIRKG
ncbi:hypothetical protein ACFX2I_008311 [Malus domestica]